MHADLLLAR